MTVNHKVEIDLKKYYIFRAREYIIKNIELLDQENYELFIQNCDDMILKEVLEILESAGIEMGLFTPALIHKKYSSYISLINRNYT